MEELGVGVCKVGLQRLLCRGDIWAEMGRRGNQPRWESGRESCRQREPLEQRL